MRQTAHRAIRTAPVHGARSATRIGHSRAIWRQGLHRDNPGHDHPMAGSSYSRVTLAPLFVPPEAVCVCGLEQGRATARRPSHRRPSRRETAGRGLRRPSSTSRFDSGPAQLGPIRTLRSRHDVLLPDDCARVVARCRTYKTRHSSSSPALNGTNSLYVSGTTQGDFPSEIVSSVSGTR